MMSLFIVLWLMGSSEKVKKAVAGYFNDPKGTASLLGTTMTGTGEAIKEASSADLEKLKEKLEEEIKARKDLENSPSKLKSPLPRRLAHRIARRQKRNVLRIGQCKIERQRTGAPVASGFGVEDASQFPAD